jgi:hypothetical protein
VNGNSNKYSAQSWLQVATCMKHAALLRDSRKRRAIIYLVACRGGNRGAARGYGHFCLFIALHCKVRRHAQKDSSTLVRTQTVLLLCVRGNMERGNVGSLVKPARSAGRRPAGSFLGRGDTLKNNETTRTCTPPGCFAEGGALGHMHAVAPQAHAACAHTRCRAMHDPRNTRHIGRFCMARLLLRPLHYQTTAARVGYLAWYGVLLLLQSS